MSENEKFEVWAQQFRKETGIWPPGKSRPRGMLPQDEFTIRAEFFAYWLLHRWIPVAERSPENISDVLALRDSTWDRAYYDEQTQKWYDASTNLCLDKITHWKLIILPASEAQSEEV